jgi:hypothetical protein
MAAQGRTSVPRLIGLNLAILLEGVAMLSIALRVTFLPIGQFYPSVVSAVIFLLPIVIGLLSKRIEAGVLLPLLPVLAIVAVYLILYAPVWNVDLFTLGVQAGRTAGALVLFAVLGLCGWLIRRLLFGPKATALGAY